MEMLRAGTTFCLRFELLVPEGEGDVLRRDLALALEGFKRGEIGLGARKRRGFGRCNVDEWRVWRYDLTTADGLIAWLAEERTGEGWEAYNLVREAEGQSLAEKLGVTIDDAPDVRRRFDMSATFRLDGSLLVRSGQGEADLGPDAVHLHRPEPDASAPDGIKRTPVLPGTSLAGVLRARSLRIANTLSSDRVRTGRLVNQILRRWA